MGAFSFNKKWLDREISKSLTGAVMLGILGIGIMMGWVCGWVTANSARCHVVLGSDTHLDWHAW
jgi:hypothetical protein